jgi:hypothetical protein
MDGGWPSDFALDQTQIPTHRVKDLIQAAIKQVEETDILRPQTLWEQWCEQNPGAKLMSTLQKALAEMEAQEAYTNMTERYRFSIHVGILANYMKSSDDGTSTTSIAASTESDKPSSNQVPLRAPFSAFYTLDGPWKNSLGGPIEQFAEQLAQRFSQTLGEHIERKPVSSPAQPYDLERLIQALEKRFVPAGPPTPPSSSPSEAGEDDAGGQASKLEYKHVIEMYGLFS